MIFLSADAVPPLSLQRDGDGWTVWDSRSVPVLRTDDGETIVKNREDAERLLPGGEGSSA